MQHIIPHTNESPFDAIKQTDEHGNEWWSARDLMEVMGYPTWQHFRPVIERAMSASANQGHTPETLFKVNREKSGGRPREDYLMPRFACYLVAMNGDPRKPEVAGAQSYFAIQTRVAETQIPQQIEMSEDEILHRALEISAGRVKALEAKVEQDAPKVDYHDTFVADEDLLSFRTVASDLKIGEQQLRQMLMGAGWIYAQHTSRWSQSKQKKIPITRYSAYAEKKNCFQAVLHHDVPRFRGEVMHTLKITPAGASAIARLVERKKAA
ncbi:phage antirepressor KilAC domain-containing protein [Auritidibacter ignavus]|uniref:Phage antirepressor KilAC domain-containing protein n=3 Tax=Auritidibacter ignavus TaxID=678932 RepID=A0AAJ6AIK4_9MICC|nr:phage antirepressor KilAC domain-containing protein [Auritidibacter ignavus]WGH87068.1 phage antirepressor KilAC domain-containing protein [Auritidibacter ignavus]WGH89352.1 phage antirepressor KilAC domain-containing protein [Auritidibacter ignavus]WGH91695.1 phage antirepressor KilAC domain-containing protein [Auritidibacter ignavus]WGH94143.1 phage antirepressor KilAC domain-containing protein [Auritidibacter ignavus]WHS27565.1 phage antirepressor KilAC domain-containing protein [Auritid